MIQLAPSRSLGINYLTIGGLMNKDQTHICDTVIAGGGIAGLVSALELLESGQCVHLIDRDTPELLGGLAKQAFGGMALSGTAQQKRMKVPDNSQQLLNDWHNFAQFEDKDIWPKKWAKEYAEQNNEKVYQWLLGLGLSFLPAVNWVERGLFSKGNSLPRYHVLWGTGEKLVKVIIDKLQPFIKQNKLVIYHQHKVLTPTMNSAGVIDGVEVKDEASSTSKATTTSTDKAATFIINAKQVIIACGGINGSLERVKQNWQLPHTNIPRQLLNGANPISDGTLHDQVTACGGQLTHADKMWNYAAGIPHPQAKFTNHGLSLIPCKSALWLNHRGERIGPMPLVTGFDTNYLCQQVAQQEQPWTWQILNWNIAAKELAVSGSQHNPAIRNEKFIQLLTELLFGNQKLIRQLEQESAEFICADSLAELVLEMNKLTDKSYIDKIKLTQQIEDFDTQLSCATSLQNDEQIRRIHHARQWKPDKLRTCKPSPILSNNSGKLIAIKLQLISRKSLGGIQTNLQSQVLNNQEQAISGLYCVGEAAGFGGGGASGKRSLEGTFLSGCILTARNAAAAIIAQKNDLLID